MVIMQNSRIGRPTLDLASVTLPACISPMPTLLALHQNKKCSQFKLSYPQKAYTGNFQDRYSHRMSYTGQIQCRPSHRKICAVGKASLLHRERKLCRFGFTCSSPNSCCFHYQIAFGHGYLLYLLLNSLLHFVNIFKIYVMHYIMDFICMPYQYF